MDDVYRTQLGTRLRELRERVGLSVDQAAEKIGIHRTTWYHYQSGRTIPDFLMAVRICRALDCELGELVPDAFLAPEERRRRRR